jgi:hypothetical protein
VDEHDVLREWRNIFRGGQKSADTLVRAEALLDGLSGESPLHLRLTQELEELKKGSAGRNKSGKVRRGTT